MSSRKRSRPSDDTSSSPSTSMSPRKRQKMSGFGKEEQLALEVVNEDFSPEDQFWFGCAWIPVELRAGTCGGTVEVKLVFANGEPVPDDFDFGTRPRASELRMLSGVCRFHVRMNSLSMYHENRGFKLVYSLREPEDGRFVKPCESNIFRLVKNKLVVCKEPSAKFYKDEGGKGNCLTLELLLIDGDKQVERARGKIPLSARLLYSDRTPAQSQRDILEVLTQNPELVEGRCVLQFRINEVSKNHNKRAFCLLVECAADEPLYQDVSAAQTHDITVYSKRTKKKKRTTPKRGGGGSQKKQRRVLSEEPGESEEAADDVFQSGGSGLSYLPPALTSLLPVGVRPGALPGAPLSLPFSAKLTDRIFKKEGENAVGSGAPKGVFHTMMDWCQLAEWVMRILEWVHCGYEMDAATGTVDPRRPLYRCCFCLKYRNCAGFGQHEADCQLKLALEQYSQQLSAFPSEFLYQSNRSDGAMPEAASALGMAPPPQSAVPVADTSAAAAMFGGFGPLMSMNPATAAAMMAMNVRGAAAVSPAALHSASVGSGNGSVETSELSHGHGHSHGGIATHAAMSAAAAAAVRGGIAAQQLHNVSAVSKERSDFGFPAFDSGQNLVGFIDESGLKPLTALESTRDFNVDHFHSSDMLMRTDSNPFSFAENVTKMVSSGFGLKA